MVDGRGTCNFQQLLITRGRGRRCASARSRISFRFVSFGPCLGTGHRSPKQGYATGSDQDPEFEIFRYKWRRWVVIFPACDLPRAFAASYSSSLSWLHLEVGRMKVILVSRSGKEVIKGGIEVHDEATVSDLQEAIYARTKKFYPSRQRLTLPLESGNQAKPVVLSPKKKLVEYCDGNVKSLTVVFKDLGVQVLYSTLFFWEYLGPLIIYPIFYFFPVYKYFGYEGERAIYPVQTYATCYWCLHYFKRIMETFFVHRFSHATSPLSNVFRNCAYYWTFGTYIAYHVNHPLYTPVSNLQMKIGFGFGLICQVSNFYCHLILRNLRSPDGNGGYQIPHGFLFNIVTCANYTTEIYQWLGFNIATQTMAGYVFLVVATLIMTNWALAKHRRLKKLFDGKDGRPRYPRRWVILPPFI